jgi:zinc protease
MDRPLDVEEIATAREAESRSFPESFEDPRSIVGILAGISQFHLPDNYLETYLDHLKETPDTEIRRAMVEVAAPAERTILIVGDRASVEPKLKAQGFRDIRLVNPDGKPLGR